MDAVNVEPGCDLFAFLDAGVGTQRARGLRLHLSGRGVFLQHGRGSAMFCRIWVLFYDAPVGGRHVLHDGAGRRLASFHGLYSRRL